MKIQTEQGKEGRRREEKKGGKNKCEEAGREITAAVGGR